MLQLISKSHISRRSRSVVSQERKIYYGEIEVITFINNLVTQSALKRSMPSKIIWLELRTEI
jgi:hypothetical protein